MQQSSNPVKITLGDHLGVFFWRNIAMPAIAAIGGKKFKDVEFKIYEGAAHGFFSFGKGSEELSDDMLLFINKY